MRITVNAIGGSCGKEHFTDLEAKQEENDERDTMSTDGSGRDLKAADKSWLDRMERMSQRAFPHEHAEVKKKEKKS